MILGFSIALVWLVAGYFGHFHWSHLAVPFIYLLQILMAVGLVWISATVCVFFRDLSRQLPSSSCF